MKGSSYADAANLFLARTPQLLRHKFCHLVVDAAISAWPDNEDARAKWARPFEDMPWVTPVLGTGTEDPLGNAEVTALAERAIRSLTDDEEQRVARRFAESLIWTRLHEKTEWETDATRTGQRSRTVDGNVVTHPPATTGGNPIGDGKAFADRVLGHSLFACAMVTNAYHQIQSWNSRAITRERDDVAVLNRDFPEWLTTRSQFVLPARQSLDALLNLNGLPRGVASLVSAMNDDLGDSRPPTVRRTALFTLTEFCWHRLSEPSVPGWSDLLWRLYMKSRVETGDEQAVDKGSTRGPRPLKGEASEIRALIKSEFLRVMADPGEAEKASPVHDAVAELLVAQAGYFSRPKASERRRQVESGEVIANPGGRKPKSPLPLAVVTSLDLRLELSLLKTHTDFLVAMPVMLYGQRSGRPFQYPWWLGLRVPGGTAGVDQLLAPTAGQWVSLHLDPSASNDQRTASADLQGRIGGLPVIVHLAGCPLIEPPDVKADSQLRAELVSALRGEAPRDEIRFSAITPQAVISEFSGLQQSLPKDRNEAVSGRAADVLQSLLQPSADALGYVRFFLLLGVQADDPAIRTRLALEIAQLIPQAEGAGWRRHGLAVNLRMEGATEDLLTEIGLDVVPASCLDFVDGIKHFARHTATKDVSSLPPGDILSNACNLGAE